MRKKSIGIDIDDTIFDTMSLYKLYGNKYCNERGMKIDILKTNSDIRHEFEYMYYNEIYSNIQSKLDAITVINKLYENYEIYIITARNIKRIPELKKITEDLFKLHKLKYDLIVYTGYSKLDDCKRLQIDLMIDNSIDVYTELKQNNINVLLYDENDSYIDINNRVSSWSDIYKYVIKNL